MISTFSVQKINWKKGFFFCRRTSVLHFEGRTALQINSMKCKGSCYKFCCMSSPSPNISWLLLNLLSQQKERKSCLCGGQKLAGRRSPRLGSHQNTNMLPVTMLTREANNQPDGVMFWLLILNGADTTDMSYQNWLCISCTELLSC